MNITMNVIRNCWLSTLCQEHIKGKVPFYVLLIMYIGLDGLCYIFPYAPDLCFQSLLDYASHVYGLTGVITKRQLIFRCIVCKSSTSSYIAPFIGSITIIKLWAFAAVHHNDPCLDLGRSQVQADATLMHITFQLHHVGGQQQQGYSTVMHITSPPIICWRAAVVANGRQESKMK